MYRGKASQMNPLNWKRKYQIILLLVMLGCFLGLTVGVRFLMVAANVSCKYAGTCLSNASEFVFACAFAGLFSISLAYYSTKYVYENRAKLPFGRKAQPCLSSGLLYAE
jgi:hypothetical protein